MADPLLAERLRTAALSVAERSKAAAEHYVEAGDVAGALMATSVSELALLNAEVAVALVETAESDVRGLERLVALLQSQQNLIQSLRGGSS